MAATKYSMAFTTGGLLFRESIVIAEQFMHLGDWAKVRNRVIEDNLLQSRMKSTLNKIYREVASRLKIMTDDQISILVDGSHQEQNHILWLGICKRYHLIRDFAVEVVREKFLQLKIDLVLEDYESFFNAKAEWHEEMERVSQSTRNKLRQVVFRMLRDTGLINSQNTIVPAIISPRVKKAIRDDVPSYLNVFPVSD